MSWTVILEDEHGNAIEKLKNEFDFEGDVINDENYKILKYLDPYGDTTFNTNMLSDLIADLTRLKLNSENNLVQIDEIIQLATLCNREPHTYLKFYGD